MIDIKINDYRITQDSRNYILSFRKVQEKDSKKRKAGDVYYDNELYFSKLDILLERLVMCELRKKGIYVLKDLINEIKDIREWFKDIINK